MKKFVILTSVLILSLAFISAVPAGEIRVGTLMAQTGPLKEYGPPIKDGAVLAGKQMAAAGFEIEFFHEDSETAPVPGTNAAKKLVDVNKVVAIVGALSSGVTLAVAESVTIPNEVILISPASTNPLMTVLPADEGKDFLFRTCPSDALQGVVAGKLAASYNKTVSILYVNNAYGQGLSEVFKETFEGKYKGKVLAMVPHDEKASESYTAELKKALAGNPDRLLAYSYPEHAKVYLKEANQRISLRLLERDVLKARRVRLPAPRVVRHFRNSMSIIKPNTGDCPPSLLSPMPMMRRPLSAWRLTRPRSRDCP
jgi:ABC-type branched-subunit amino acid transport system substrate-binding protein